MYTGEMELDTEVANVLILAERYQIDDLKLICERKLCNQIDKNNVGEMLYLADLYNCKILRRAVVDLVSLWVTLEPCFPFSSYMYLRNFLLDWQLHLNAFLFSSLLLLSFVLEYIINIRLLFIASFSYLLLLCFLIA